MKKSNLNKIENLENRNLFAADVFLDANAVLNVSGDNGNNDIEFYQTATGGPVNVFVEGVLTNTFTGVSKIIVNGNNGNDSITNNTFVDSDMFGGNGHDTLQGGGGNDRMLGQNGNDIITNFVTDSNYNPIGAFTNDILDGGNGNDSLWGGWGSSDVLLGGNGDDSIYDIVGGSNYIDGGKGNDWTISRTGVGLPTNPISGGGLVSDILVADTRDRNVVQFDAGTQAAGPILINRTLYVLNLNTGNVVANKVGNQVLLNYNGVTSQYNAKDIDTIAGIGGNGNDTFVNNTNIKSVFYGQGGNDVLLGGSNNDVLKGGNGNDYLDGRGGSDDITGDAGTDVLVSKRKDRDIVRADYDPVNNLYLDLVFSDIGDRIVQKKIRF